MAKLIIKESSIRDDVNLRYFDIIKNELAKYVNTSFSGMYRTGNFAIAESTNIELSNFNIGNTPESLEYFINNTLNFRYENYTIMYSKN